MIDIATNLRAIRQKIADAAKASGGTADAIKLIAVSKGATEAQVRIAIKAGQDVFGENRVQEAKIKFANLRNLHIPLELHLIGPLQTNKAEDAVRIFDVIQTVDRPRIAEALAVAIKKVKRTPKFYVEVNLGFEPQKAGIAPEDLEMFLKYCRGSCGLSIEGLMCIPPQTDRPETHFKNLSLLAKRHKLLHVSMGMSADYETAIKCGATEVRVGTAIFGERKKI